MNSCGWLLLSIAENCILKKKEKSMSIKFNQRNLKIAIAASILVGSAGLTVPAYAVTSNLNVTANIDMNCTVSTTAVAFGAYKPTTDHASTDLTANGAIKTTCTVGSTGKVIIGQGQHFGATGDDAVSRRMATSDDSNFIIYDVFSDSDRLNSWSHVENSGIAYAATGSEETMVVYGKIPSGQTSAAQGSYADVLLVTVNF
jgi:spore coat protein U-like protein